MSVCAIIPPTHSRAIHITPLTESMLHEGLQHVLRANKTLQRSLPNNVLKTGLLQRNYWVVRDTNLVLAFGHFDTTKPHTLQGETGWSVQCACANVPMCQCVQCVQCVHVCLHRPVVPIWLPTTEICPMSPALPTPSKHYHRGKQTHQSSNDTRITQFISENHSDGN